MMTGTNRCCLDPTAVFADVTVRAGFAPRAIDGEPHVAVDGEPLSFGRVRCRRPSVAAAPLPLTTRSERDRPAFAGSRSAATVVGAGHPERKNDGINVLSDRWYARVRDG